MKKIFFTFTTLISLLALRTAEAQLKIAPIAPARAHHSEQIRKSTAAGHDTIFIDFPLFDDFSALQGSPDPTKWSRSDGVYINNHMSETPPTIGMATFDGTDSTGTPYDFPNEFNTDEADSLTSHFIDLSGFSPADDFRVSFYWQAEGLGERPDPTDSLQLQFLDTAGAWQTAWAVPGDSARAFQQETVLLDDPAFYHRFFRFRFVNTARLSGPYDTWHLDYVYFYRNAADNPRQRLDVALSGQPTPALSRYTAMPLQQFLAAPALETADTIALTIRHLSDTFNVISHTASVRDLYSGQNFGNFTTGSSGRNTSFTGTNLIFNFEDLAFLTLNDLSFVQEDFDSLALEYTFAVNSNESNSLIRTTANDTLRQVTYLHNFYAYDDGSAEYGIGVFQRFGQMAYQFILNEPAQITAIDVYLTQIGSNLTGQTFNLLLWESIDTVDKANDVRLLRQNLPLIYPEEINQFRRFELAQPFLLEDTFYIGVEQLSEEVLTVGYDVHTPSGEKIFYNTGGRWRQNRNFPGSMLLRPVFNAAPDDPTSLPHEKLQPAIRVYPNPATGFFQLEGNIEEARLFDLTGKMVKVLEINLQQQTHRYALDGLPPGLYLIRGTTPQGHFAEKLLVR